MAANQKARSGITWFQCSHSSGIPLFPVFVTYADLGLSCGMEEFQCSGGACIPALWRCDGDSDCSDASDEANCPRESSPPLHRGPNFMTGTVIYSAGGECDARTFQCANGECVLAGWRCDGDSDCSDGSDEDNCTRTWPRVQYLRRQRQPSLAFFGQTFLIICEPPVPF